MYIMYTCRLRKISTRTHLLFEQSLNIYTTLYSASHISASSINNLYFNNLSITALHVHMGWLWLVGSLKLQVSFAKEPYKRDDILQKRPVILRSLLIVATSYLNLSGPTRLNTLLCGHRWLMRSTSHQPSMSAQSFAQLTKKS